MKMSYFHTLLAEVCTGVAPEVNAKALAWGKQYENDARTLFEFTSGVNITESPIIYRDEKRHVAFGMKWFRYLCDRERLQPEPTFHDLVRKNFRGPIKPPFNDLARAEAGLTPGFYKPLSALGVTR